ncbi:MAG: 5-(carboxyamino)imidazole ribonucleotide mutase [Candidatus Scalindua sp. AMX11]|nr:MAG: 5-(carboxyamino)imidazole ribonucleotide mutase [Candidatus Scalindua sp.]NOG82784.1 5-(carboxyamino)imidazole ribonucleotide mutase [Planctomycetota bacterium]RZV95349.1 MAG: 5-(carboxyamino)imidazole ribonucleotide mutase [Candidatus Scalindua sp. SCAELEC01]TDE66167.1 MAG: 5-(carboxyamino)imidazole ribonucleotide mutase [Candidatus Scalindua sp. AMX11]GJQ57785.1 MAG: 5-(carboxyamino)imidazole ribonucleotide mutase [Candidatus Scalindua sp.]
MNKILIGIIMGSDSDLEVMKKAAQILEKFEIGYEMNIISAHRTPNLAHEYAVNSVGRGLEVIIAGAGGAAHLAGVIAASTPLPVIGVPMQTDSLGGMDSLLSIAQMPSGIPVATMAIGKAGATNAAILAAQILGAKYPDTREKVNAYKNELAEKVVEKNRKLQETKK